MSDCHRPIDLFSIHNSATLLFQAGMAAVVAAAVIFGIIALIEVLVQSFKARDWIAGLLLFIIVMLALGMVAVATDPNPPTANPLAPYSS